MSIYRVLYHLGSPELSEVLLYVDSAEVAKHEVSEAFPGAIIEGVAKLSEVA